CGNRCVHEIDLTAIDDSATETFWSFAAETIRRRMDRFYDSDFDGRVPTHVSVFALAPIPQLMMLGRTLSDKVPTSLYQRDRDTENWVWKQEGKEVEFATQCVRRGTEDGGVAVIVSVSGVVAEQDLPAHVDNSYTVYSLSPANAKPDRSILDREASFQAFRA